MIFTATKYFCQLVNGKRVKIVLFHIAEKAGKMTVDIDETMTEYIQKIEKTKTAKKLETRKKKKGAKEDLHETTSESEG